MATGDTGPATFTCPNCGAVYQCTYRNFPGPDSAQTFKCTNDGCGATVYSWKGTRDYFDWKLLVKPEKAMNP
jgi:hypothetical protein